MTDKKALYFFAGEEGQEIGFIRYVWWFSLGQFLGFCQTLRPRLKLCRFTLFLRFFSFSLPEWPNIYCAPFCIRTFFKVFGTFTMLLVNRKSFGFNFNGDWSSRRLKQSISWLPIHVLLNSSIGNFRHGANTCKSTVVCTSWSFFALAVAAAFFFMKCWCSCKSFRVDGFLLFEIRNENCFSI